MIVFALNKAKQTCLFGINVFLVYVFVAFVI